MIWKENLSHFKDFDSDPHHHQIEGHGDEEEKEERKGNNPQEIFRSDTEDFKEQLEMLDEKKRRKTVV